MSRFLWLPLLVTTAILIGCGDDDSPTGPSNASTSPSSGGSRDITKAMLASCPAMPAAPRVAGDIGTTTGAPVGQTSAGFTVVYGFYDTTGHFLVGGKQQIQYPAMASRYLIFNGKDAAGNALPTGHYLVFHEIRDLEGNLIDKRGTCFGYVTSSSP